MMIATFIGIIFILIYNMYMKSSLTDQIDTLRRVIMADLTELRTAVTEIDSIGDGVIDMLNGIAAQLEAARGNQEEIDQLAADIRQQSADFADAVAAHTPAEEDGQEVPAHPEPDDEDIVIEDPGPPAEDGDVVVDAEEVDAMSSDTEDDNKIFYGDQEPGDDNPQTD